jgi:hypothetical protein
MTRFVAFDLREQMKYLRFFGVCQARVPFLSFFNIFFYSIHFFHRLSSPLSLSLSSERSPLPPTPTPSR